jgi:hypothetical protein
MPAIRSDNTSKLRIRDRAPKMTVKVRKEQGLFVGKAHLIRRGNQCAPVFAVSGAAQYKASFLGFTAYLRRSRLRRLRDRKGG